jgi:hypothetical protein
MARASSKGIELPDFLKTDDPWFRPVDLQWGPDSALYVADFYNRIMATTNAAHGVEFIPKNRATAGQSYGGRIGAYRRAGEERARRKAWTGEDSGRQLCAKDLFRR